MKRNIFILMITAMSLLFAVSVVFAGGTGKDKMSESGMSGDIATLCPMNIKGVEVVAAQNPEGVTLTYTEPVEQFWGHINKKKVGELQQRVKNIADRFNSLDFNQQHQLLSSKPSTMLKKSQKVEGMETIAPIQAKYISLVNGAQIEFTINQPQQHAWQVYNLRNNVEQYSNLMAQGQCPILQNMGQFGPVQTSMLY